MNPIIFALVLLCIVFILSVYKGKTAFKAHTRHKQLIDEISATDREINGLLRHIVGYGVKPLFLLKSLSGLFYRKKAEQALNEFDKNDQKLISIYTIEAIKTYFVYAPHWLVVVLILMAFVGFFAVLFSSFDRLKQALLIPVELKLIRH